MQPRFFGVSYGSPQRQISLAEYSDEEVIEAALLVTGSLGDAKRKHMGECPACGGVHHGLWCRYGTLLHLVAGESMYHITFQVISQELGRQCEEIEDYDLG